MTPHKIVFMWANITLNQSNPTGFNQLILNNCDQERQLAHSKAPILKIFYCTKSDMIALH